MPNVRVYVLGPPSDPAALKVTNPRKTKHEGYEVVQLAAEAAGFVDALDTALTGAAAERSFPFDARHRRAEAAMQGDPFFQRYYFGGKPTRRHPRASAASRGIRTSRKSSSAGRSTQPG